MKTLLRLLVLLLAIAASPAPILAQGTPQAAEETPEKKIVTLENADQLFPKWEKDAAAMEQRLQSEAITTDVLGEIREVLDPQRVNARALATQAKGQLAPLLAQVEALGTAPEEGAPVEDPAVTAERDEINKRIAGLRAVVSKSDLAFTRADRLMATATDAQRTRFTNELLQRGPNRSIRATG